MSGSIGDIKSIVVNSDIPRKLPVDFAAVDDELFDFSIADASSRLVAGLKNGKWITSAGVPKGGGSLGDELSVDDESLFDFSVEDSSGNVAFGVKNGIAFPGSEPKVAGLDDSSALGVDEYGYVGDFDNPLKALTTGVGLAHLFPTWGIIGDSFSSGHQDYYVAGSRPTDANRRGPLSWPGIFCALNETDGAYFTRSGQTAIHFIQDDGDACWKAGNDSNNMTRGANNPRTAYIISLGINDSGQIGEGKTYFGGIGTLKDSVDLSDYTKNDESTFIGCYAGIIQRIKEVQPRAQIFVTTVKEWLNNKDVNDIIREMPDVFTRTHLIDNDKWRKHFAEHFSGHPNQLGHQYIATCYSTYVDWLIRRYPSDFNDAFLIGRTPEAYLDPCFSVVLTFADESGKPKAGLKVGLLEGSRLNRPLVTGADGKVSLTLPNGDYVLKCSASVLKTRNFTVKDAALAVAVQCSEPSAAQAESATEATEQ